MTELELIDACIKEFPFNDNGKVQIIVAKYYDKNANWTARAYPMAGGETYLGAFGSYFRPTEQSALEELLENLKAYNKKKQK